jgi:hypothetical protein
MLRFGKVIVMTASANREEFEIVTCDTSCMNRVSNSHCWGKATVKIKEKAMLTSLDTLLTFLVTLTILSTLILIGMMISLHLSTSGALRDKPLRLLRHLKSLVAA